jgi:hypothetical protein
MSKLAKAGFAVVALATLVACGSPAPEPVTIIEPEPVTGKF